MSDSETQKRRRLSAEFMHSPLQKTVKYLALKWCHDRHSKRLEKFLPEFKQSYVDSLRYTEHTDDPVLPPCVNCLPEQVYYCYRFQIECRAVMSYYGGKFRCKTKRVRKRKPVINNPQGGK